MKKKEILLLAIVLLSSFFMADSAGTVKATETKKLFQETL